MKAIQFSNPSAGRIYTEYLHRCSKALKSLTDADKEDCLLEVNSFIYENLQANSNATADEVEQILNILDRLGAPEEMFQETIAARKIDQAVRSFNPAIVLQALLLNIRNGIIYVVLFVLYLLLFSFPVLIVLKIISPRKTGVFIGPHTFVIGCSNDAVPTTELLGNAFIPVLMLTTVVLYFLIVSILKIVKTKKA